MSGKRQWYEIRIREEVGPTRYMKKSKFYFEVGPKEAERHYRGKGHIMSCEKVPVERLLGVGEFFKLGDEFLKELNTPVPNPEKQIMGEKHRDKKYFGKRRQEFNENY